MVSKNHEFAMQLFYRILCDITYNSLMFIDYEKIIKSIWLGPVKVGNESNSLPLEVGKV